MQTVKVSPKFQVVIPKELRERLHLRPGQDLVIYEVEGQIRLETGCVSPRVSEGWRGACSGEESDRDHAERLRSFFSWILPAGSNSWGDGPRADEIRAVFRARRADDRTGDCALRSLQKTIIVAGFYSCVTGFYLPHCGPVWCRSTSGWLCWQRESARTADWQWPTR